MKDNRPKQGARRGSARVTWAQAFRDIIHTAINRGQLPILGLLAVVVIVVLRMPEADVAGLAKELLDSLRHGDLWGYVLWGATIGAWYSYAKRMRRMFSDEFQRIGLEKSKLQSQLTGSNYRSSNRS